jgi:pyridoxal phosphate enzyme (YggS family)
MGTIAENITAVKRRLDAVCRRCGRGPDNVTLVAVSKTHPPMAIREAFEAGITSFGENYAQELREKAGELGDLPISWHFIGHLQRNKVKYVAAWASVIETIDSAELADRIDERVQAPIKALIEVNIGGEASKSGVPKDDVPTLIRHISTLKNISLTGLMIIPPYDPDPEHSRPHFKNLKRFLDEINSKLPEDTKLSDLSMGMSHDFEVAIEEGATIVRVGAAIFGERT